MSTSLDLPGNALVAMTRDSLLVLRAAMFRDVGPNAAVLLQEAGFAGGQALFDTFGNWLSARGLPAPGRDPHCRARVPCVPPPRWLRLAERPAR